MIIEIRSAVNELLLAKVPEVAELLDKVRLHAPDCGERPAAAALSLVLYWGDDREISPVPMGWNVSLRIYWQGVLC
jgi:hypothetical protein